MGGAPVFDSSGDNRIGNTEEIFYDADGSRTAPTRASFESRVDA
jgi:hypothetical protein